MAKRGWSLTEAQLESYGDFRRRKKLNPAARSAQAPTPRKSIFDGGMPTGPAVPSRPSQRPSPDRLRERAGRSGKETGDSQFYNRTTYEHADVSGSGRQPLYTPGARGGRGNEDDPTVPTRSMASPPSPKSPAGMKRRQASTQAAYRAADASMFNSNVTPKAERVENKRPRSRMSPDQNVFW